jgi:hypothetical protein
MDSSLTRAVEKRCQHLQSEEFEVTLWKAIQNTIEGNGGKVNQEGLGFLTSLIRTDFLIAYSALVSLASFVFSDEFAEKLTHNSFKVILSTVESSGILIMYEKIHKERIKRYLEVFQLESKFRDEPPKHKEMLLVFAEAFVEDVWEDMLSSNAIDATNFEPVEDSEKADLLILLGQEAAGAMNEFIQIAQEILLKEMK